MRGVSWEEESAVVRPTESNSVRDRIETRSVVERSNQNLGDSWTGIDPMKMLDDSSLSGIDFSQGLSSNGRTEVQSA